MHPVASIQEERAHVFHQAVMSTTPEEGTSGMNAGKDVMIDKHTSPQLSFLGN